MAEDASLDTLDTGTDAPVDDLRSDIADAFDQVETRETVAAPTPTGGAPASTSPAGSSSDRTRGPDGRYLPDSPQKPAGATGSPGEPPTSTPPTPAAQKPPIPAAGASAGAEPAQTAPKAPASWKPQAREHWAKLPAEVQQEVHRRETEVGRALQESSKAREALSQVQQTLAPYAANIQASGSDVVTAIGNLFRADNTLRHGSQGDKCLLVADIIKNYGVDLQTLDTTLATGQQVAPDPQEVIAQRLEQKMQAQLQPVMQFFNQMQGQREEALNASREKGRNEVRSFGQDDQHEFFADVRQDMADIVDFYHARNQPITLQEAYDRAIMLNPQISEIISRRAEAQRVNSQAQAAQRARRAAASIGGSPAPAGLPGPASGADRRAEIEAAWDAHGSS